MIVDLFVLMTGANLLCAKMTQLLLEKGATINTFDKKDRRAMHWAAYMGHVDIVRLLVSFGAELSCRDKQVLNGIELHRFCLIYHILCSASVAPHMMLYRCHYYLYYCYYVAAINILAYSHASVTFLKFLEIIL